MGGTIANPKSNGTRPRILFVEGSTGFGGSGTVLLDLLSHLDRSHFSFCVATYFPARSTSLERIEASGIPYCPVTQGRVFEPWAAPFVTRQRNRWLRKPALLASWSYYWLVVQGVLVLRFLRLLHKERISAVVFNNDVHMHAAGIVATKLAGKPALVRKGGGIGEGRAIKILLTPLVDLFIPISEATRADQAKNVGPARIKLIYPGVDLSKFQNLLTRKEARRKFGLPQDMMIVGSSSRLAEGKGQRELLQAAKKVREHRPDTFFCIAGAEDPAFSQQNLLVRLKALAGDLGIADHVVFLGWCGAIPSLLAAMDVFVHCPTTFIEGLSIANLEAMACGLPTIVSRNGGLPDAVVHQITGYVVEPGDIEGMSKAILGLLSDPDRARQMGQNGKQRISERFEIRRMARDYEKLFEEYCLGK